LLELSKKSKIFIIPGNHDFSASDGLSPLAFINLFQSEIKVIEYREIFDEGSKINLDKISFDIEGLKFYFLPYMSNKNLLNQAIEDILEQGGDKFLTIHQIIIPDIARMKSAWSGVDIAFEHLKNFKFIFLGHYHTPYDYSNFSYVGSTEALKYNEYEYDKNGYIKEKTKKRINVYEINEGEIKIQPIILKKTRNFIFMEFEEPEISFLENEIKNRFDEQSIFNLKVKISDIKAQNDLKFIETKYKEHFFYLHMNIELSLKEGKEKIPYDDSQKLMRHYLGEFYDATNELITAFESQDDKSNIDKDQIEKIILNENKIYQN
jgi:DNA repair exonuclease SbcCD nuclease subunit